MPTYYFDLWDGQQLDPDEIGVELSTLEAAFEMAVRTAEEMLSDGSLKGHDRSDWAFKVIDERGAYLFTFEFSKAVAEPHYSRVWRAF